MTTDNLLTGTAPANAGDDGSNGGTPPASDTSTTQEAKAPEGGAEGKQAGEEGKAPDAKPAEGEAGKDEGKQDEPAGAPEKYEWQAPEGVTLDTEVLSEFEQYARELNLPQDKAQAAVDLGLKMLDKWQQGLVDQHLATRNQWAEEAKADSELGGAKFNENLAVANAALQAIGSPELTELLTQTGLCNNIHVIRALYRVGKQVTPDQIVGGNRGEAKPDLATRLYAKSMGNK